MKARYAAALLVLSLSTLATTGCGGEDKLYVPKPALSGKKAAIPAVPTLPQKNKKEGDAYTIWGVTHELRSIVHHDDVTDKKLSLVGYIVKTNLVPCKNKEEKDGTKEDCTPECAVHKTGKADPPDCKAPVPAFYIADTKDEKNEIIQVTGFASNFARLHDAIEEIDKTPTAKQKDKDFTDKLMDAVWNVAIPNPIPAVGAKVKVSGQYGMTFERATGGPAIDQKHGILTLESVEYLEPAPALAELPGMKPRKPTK